MQEVEQDRQRAEGQAMNMKREELQVQAMKSPLADPTKNPALAQQLAEGGGGSPQPMAADIPTNQAPEYS